MSIPQERVHIRAMEEIVDVAVHQIQENRRSREGNPSRGRATAHSGAERGCAHVSECQGLRGSCSIHFTGACSERSVEQIVDGPCIQNLSMVRHVCCSRRLTSHFMRPTKRKKTLEVEEHVHAPHCVVDREWSDRGWSCDGRCRQDLRRSRRLIRQSWWSRRSSDTHRNRRKS